MNLLRMFLGLVLSLGASSFASAELALFNGTTQKLGFDNAGVFSQTNAIATLPHGTGPATGFKIPAWGSTSFSFTFSSGIYLNFDVYRTEIVQPGSFTKSFHPLNASYTIMHNESGYPARPTTPAPGWWNLQIGPNGFGGVQTHIFKTKYVGTVAASPGFSYLYLDVSIHHNAASLSAGPHAFDGGGRTNFTTLDKKGEVWVFTPMRNHMTGTFTAVERFATPQTLTLMAADSRNGKGTMGTIQMIAPEIAYNYLLPGPYTGLEDQPVGAMQSETWQYQRTTLEFIPEPHSLSLWATGLLGLLGIHSMQSQRRTQDAKIQTTYPGTIHAGG